MPRNGWIRSCPCVQHGWREVWCRTSPLSSLFCLQGPVCWRLLTWFGFVRMSTLLAMMIATPLLLATMISGQRLSKPFSLLCVQSLQVSTFRKCHKFIQFYILLRFCKIGPVQKNSSLPGVEPGIFWSVVRRVIHCATSPDTRLIIIIIYWTVLIWHLHCPVTIIERICLIRSDAFDTIVIACSFPFRVHALSINFTV